MADKSCKLPRRARVVRNERVSPTGTHFIRFEVVDGGAFDFRPGEFVAVDCEHRVLGYRRSPYCIASPPNSKGLFDLLVREIPEGPVSVFLVGLEEGDVIGFRGPAGSALPLPDDSSEMVLLATGVGLSPFFPLLAAAAHQDALRRITLYWGLRRVEDICLIEHLETWRRRLCDFSYRISLSQPPREWSGLQGRLTESVPPRLTRLRDKQFYLVGNGAMIVELGEALALAGVPRSRMWDEPFFNTRYRSSPERVRRIRARIPAVDIPAPFENLQARLGPRG